VLRFHAEAVLTEVVWSGGERERKSELIGELMAVWDRFGQVGGR